jgi:hypothetical protein
MSCSYLCRFRLVNSTKSFVMFEETLGPAEAVAFEPPFAVNLVRRETSRRCRRSTGC